MREVEVGRWRRRAKELGNVAVAGEQRRVRLEGVDDASARACARKRIGGDKAHGAARVEDDGHRERAESRRRELAAVRHEPSPREHAAELSGVHGDERAVAGAVYGPVGREAHPLRQLQREAVARGIDTHDDELRAPSFARRGELGVAPLNARARGVPVNRSSESR